MSTEHGDSEPIKEFEFGMVRDELLDLTRGLHRKIAILSHSQLRLDDEHEKVELSHIIKTCTDILNYAECQEQNICELMQTSDGAEEQATRLWERCDELTAERDSLLCKVAELETAHDSSRQSMTHSAMQISSYEAVVDALSMDVESVDLEAIVAKLQPIHATVGTDSKLKKAAQNLFDLIHKNENEMVAMRENQRELEESMELKLKHVEASSREENLTLCNLIKRNNAYLVATQKKIVSLSTEKNKLDTKCVHWKKLCHQQSAIIKRLEHRNSNITNALQSINIAHAKALG